ncbi:MAG: ABC transporter permease [Paracoccaceae bacterium]|nr:ABC transporter permease [Paracoccaceae bacterium]
MTHTNSTRFAGGSGFAGLRERFAAFRGGIRGLVMAALGLAIVLLVWQAIVRAFSVPVYLVPAPTDVLVALYNDRILLAQNAVPTITEAALGFLLGNIFAILVAISFVYNKIVEDLFYPVAILIKTIPIIAIAPVLKIMLGNGIEPKVLIAALICFFPTLVNAVQGFRAVNPQLIELMHVLSASKTQVFRRVRFYAALPYAFAALKVSVTMCVLGAIVGEWIGANTGIGYLILQSMYVFDTPRLFATIIVASLMAIAGFALVTWVESRVIHWDPGENF